MMLCCFLQVIFLSLLFLLIARKSPHRLFYTVSPALVCGAGTASSSATLPVTLSCLSKSKHVTHSVVRFLLPLGTTLNMNATAILQSVGPIFFLQRLERPVGLSSFIIVLFSALSTSMVTGTVPSGGLITMTTTLSALGKVNYLEKRLQGVLTHPSV